MDILKTGLKSAQPDHTFFKILCVPFSCQNLLRFHIAASLLAIWKTDNQEQATKTGYWRVFVRRCWA